jgi:hypothetical protein
MTTEVLTKAEIEKVFAACNKAGSFYQHHAGAATAFARAIERALLARLGEQQPVAWMDDGNTKSGSGDNTSFRVVTDKTKSRLLKSIAASFITPLYTHPSPAPVGAQSDYVLQLLVAGGHVTQAKVDEARAIAAKVVQAVGAQEREAMPPYTPEQRAAACVAACEGLPDHALYGGWTAAGLSKYAKSLEDKLAARSAAQGAAQVPAGVDDLATLVVRLVRALRKAAPGNELSYKAMDYLMRHDLAPSPFRALSAAPSPAGERTSTEGDAT